MDKNCYSRLIIYAYPSPSVLWASLCSLECHVGAQHLNISSPDYFSNCMFKPVNKPGYRHIHPCSDFFSYQVTDSIVSTVIDWMQDEGGGRFGDVYWGMTQKNTCRAVKRWKVGGGDMQWRFLSHRAKWGQSKRAKCFSRKGESVSFYPKCPACVHSCYQQTWDLYTQKCLVICFTVTHWSTHEAYMTKQILKMKSKENITAIMINMKRVKTRG